MKVFFLFVSLLIVTTANAQQPTVTWETEASEDMTDIPVSLKNFHGLIIFERHSTEVFELLNMIFFPKDSSSLGRYVVFTDPNQTTNYSEDTTTATLNAHYNILNILGHRLRVYPKTTIGLTGCSGSDAGEFTLAAARAEAIKKYLVSIWGIDPKRITIATRILPKYPSDGNSEKGREENRRVEIVSDDWNIVGPVIAIHYARFPDPRKAFLYVSPNTDSSIVERKIRIFYRHKPWALISVPKSDTTIEWNWRSDATRLLPEWEGTLSAQLFLTDAYGRTIETAIDSIEIKVAHHTPIIEHPSDMRREIYNMTLRPDEENAIGKLNKTYIDSIVLPRITPRSTVQIFGYVNEDSRKNRERSEKLIAAIKKYIEPKTTIDSRNITTEFYSNGVLFYPEFPEERMLNRAAQIIIATPYDN